MEKIIITCNAEYLSYEFPKRKWYQLFQPDRIALMRLDSVEKENLNLDIQLRVSENIQTDFSYAIDFRYRRELFEAMIHDYQMFYEQLEHVVLLDFGEELLVELAYELSRNRNYLTILTDKPERYEYVLAKIESEFGLVGMVFTEYRELIRYLKAVSRENKVFSVIGSSEPLGEGQEETISMEKNKRNILYQLPKKSFLMDFSNNEFFCSHILKKRMNFTYVNIPIFLDNIVKNRYNAVVNEGITFQVINKKTFRRRKGNKDGREEEYSDL